jgi:hypothetical protein
MDISQSPPPACLASGSQGRQIATTLSAAEAGYAQQVAPTPLPPVQVAAVLAIDVKTHYDPMSKTLVASVIDKESGTVVTEIPPEALRDLAYRTAEFRGRLLDRKV